MPNHPIFAPTSHRKVTAVKLLLAGEGTLVEIRDAKTLAPLHVAASRGQSAIAQLWLDHGANVHGPRLTVD